MTTTATGRELTAVHRTEQLAVRGRMLSLLLEVWPLFDPTRIDETWLPLEPVLLGMVDQSRDQSASIASTYYAQFRAAEGVPGTTFIPSLEPVDREQLATSLRVTGPVTAKRLTAAARPDVATRTYTSVGGAMSRLALNGGIDTILGAVRQDERAVGWARMTSWQPCAFCAMLAGRGGVYSTKDTASFRSHDSCACTPVAVYDRTASLPGRGDDFAALYNDATAGAPRGGQLRAFRRAYEGLTTG